MEKYVVILKNKISDVIEPGLNQRHCDHLRKLANEGTLFLCGPLIGHGGAMQILYAHSLEEAIELDFVWKKVILGKMRATVEPLQTVTTQYDYILETSVL